MGVVGRPLSRLGTQIRDFPSAVECFSFKSCLRCISSGCCCIGGCHTHVQSRAASRDSSGGEKIGQSGCGTVVTPESASLGASHDGVIASIVPSSGFGGAANFALLKLGEGGRGGEGGGSKNAPHRRHPPSPMQLRLPFSSARW